MTKRARWRTDAGLKAKIALGALREEATVADLDADGIRRAKRFSERMADANPAIKDYVAGMRTDTRWTNIGA
jgi:hypothetical protein